MTFPTAYTFIVIIETIGIPSNDVAEVWLEDPVITRTVPINALRPVGCSVDPEYEALMASKLIESNRNRFVEAAWGQCCATSFGRQASDNHSASDAEHAFVM